MEVFFVFNLPGKDDAYRLYLQKAGSRNFGNLVHAWVLSLSSNHTNCLQTCFFVVVCISHGSFQHRLMQSYTNIIFSNLLFQYFQDET
jgi:hypothetical protein